MGGLASGGFVPSPDVYSSVTRRRLLAQQIPFRRGRTALFLVNNQDREKDRRDARGAVHFSFGS